MKVKTDLTIDDYLNYDKFIIMNTPKLRFKAFISLACMPIAILALGIVIKFPIIYVILITIVAGGLFDAFSLYLSKKRTKKILLNTKGCLGEHSFEINEDSLKKTNANGERFIKWDKIKHVSENIEYIYIFVGNSYAQIIPKRSFKSDSESREFFDKALDLWLKNKK